jgi:hypothetical protein
MEIVGSQIGEFLDAPPPPPEACVSKGATVQTPPWGLELRQQLFTRGATSSLCLALYTIIFIKLCFSFMSIFALLNPHAVS